MIINDYYISWLMVAFEFQRLARAMPNDYFLLIVNIKKQIWNFRDGNWADISLVKQIS